MQGHIPSEWNGNTHVTDNTFLKGITKEQHNTVMREDAPELFHRGHKDLPEQTWEEMPPDECGSSPHYLRL